MSDTIHGILPNIYSKEKFVSVLNKIRNQHIVEENIYNAFYSGYGSIEYPNVTEDLLVKSLEIMFMDYGGLISSFIYDYNFCCEDDTCITITESDKKTGKTTKYLISSAEELYDYLIATLFVKLLNMALHDKENQNKEESNNGNIDDFVNVFNAIYGGSKKKGSGEQDDLCDCK